ncbi:MAG: calcium-binding protein [Paracoccaceae bacterium]
MAFKRTGTNGNDTLDARTFLSIQLNNNLVGLAGDDHLRGGRIDDTLDGGADNDTLFGDKGDDLLIGGDGDDVLNGEDHGWKFNDTLLGGAGNDVIRADEGDDADGGTGRDLFVASNATRMRKRGGSELDYSRAVDLESGTHDVLYTPGGRLLSVDTLDLLDYEDHVADPRNFRSRADGFEDVRGTPSSDALYGSEDANHIDGGGLNDMLAGRGGDDTIFSGSGVDTVVGGEGDDLIVGTGEGGVLMGNAGNDTIDASGGTGAGYLIAPGTGSDRITGGAGPDTLDYSDYGVAEAAGITVDLTLGYAIGAGKIDLFSGIANATGTDWDDLIRGNDGANVLKGLGSDDRIEGREGDDRIDGGRGNDLLNGEEGLDTLEGGAGNDTLNGGTGLDVLIGNIGRDTFISEGDGETDDLIALAEGRSHLEQNEGDGWQDVFVFYEGFGRDNIFGFEPDLDVIDLSEHRQAMEIDDLYIYSPDGSATLVVGQDHIILIGHAGIELNEIEFVF